MSKIKQLKLESQAIEKKINQSNNLSMSIHIYVEKLGRWEN